MIRKRTLRLMVLTVVASLGGAVVSNAFPVDAVSALREVSSIGMALGCLGGGLAGVLRLGRSSPTV